MEISQYYETETAGGRIGLATCYECGAAIIVNEQELDAVKKHREFHEGISNNK